MTCEHCCFDCTSVGTDMSLKIFEKACKIAESLDDYISIGGGEPTLNPNFWAMLGLSLGCSAENYVWLATNGSQTETALRLANMARKGIIGVALSQDEYHDEIDPHVIMAFQHHEFDNYDSRGDNDQREIRDVTSRHHSLVDAGRAKKNHIGSRNECVCDDLFITPNGKIYGCGCKTHCFGTVDNYNIPNWYYNLDGHCTRNYKERVAV